MTEDKQLFLFGHTLPGNENLLLERIKECAEKRNKGYCSTSPGCTVLRKIPAEDVLQVTAGHNYVAFLLKDHRVARLRYEIVANTIESTAPTDKNESGPGSSTAPATTTAGSSDPASASANAAANAANRTAKIRRIMMTRPGTRSGGFCRTGVVIDRNRSRPMIPASSVPEDLIVQCQVVLQGKSRDVIVRELQRTNLNVNEAVNNLLSRDDDEMDDLDDTSEAYLHEELLSLLDAGLRSDGSGAAAAALLDSDSIYSAGDGYEYLISRDLARRKGEDKTKDQNKENADSSSTIQEHFFLGERYTYWGLNGNDVADGSTKFQFPDDVTKFVKIVSMQSELIALADNGKIYGWSWEIDSKPDNSPHVANDILFSSIDIEGEGEADSISNIESSGLRTAVLSKNGLVGSFVDISCGNRLGRILSETPIEMPEPVDKLLCCTLYSAVLTKNGNIFWRGIYPFNERRKIWEKIRARKKQVTFESCGSEIVVGSEVRTKSTPIYSFGSIAVNFSQGIPMDAWTLNETCRFRVFGSANAYDNYNGEKLQQQKEKRVSFNLAGNRKRNAPSAQAENEQRQSSTTAQPLSGSGSTSANNSSDFAGKESAWNLKDCIFIHEEAVNDTSIVKIVDGAYCGIVFKSTMEKLESEPSTDLSKMGIRLMRKDDLVLVSSSSRGSRSPENFQMQFKQIRLPSSVKQVLSVAVDLTGFRVLCEKQSRVHLLRISCVGKLLSDHPIPVNFGALTQNKKDDSYECMTTVQNFGDESILLLNDGFGGGFQPLLRNISGGYKQLSYTGLGRILQYGMGIRYFASSGEIKSASICSEQISVDKKNNSLNKNANRILLMVALVSPSPECTLPDHGSLMQAILFCQLDVVIAILKKLLNSPIESQPAIVCEQIEGNRNIFHVAVQNAYSRTNADQADVDATDSRLSTASQKSDTVEADAVKTRYERKWQEMISSAPTTRAKAHQQQQLLNELTSEIKKDSSPETGKDEPESAESSDLINKRIPIAAKERQANSIEIIRELCKNSVVREYFIDLMRQRDINGHSPFETAIYQRAYSAAQLMWQTAIDVKDWSQGYF
ncbi:unnamed protein product [Meloidogyne enterolobii]|uniref:Uncharacterized protein n=1 Tax=Meloidogyne enterolobii TaxID=390850 RepID=A0ACB1AXU8_MELEN